MSVPPTGEESAAGEPTPTGGPTPTSGPSVGESATQDAPAGSHSAEEPAADRRMTDELRVGDSPEELLELACDEALLAGALLLDSYLGSDAHEIDSKSTPTDLVSEADHLAEESIRERVAMSRPDDGFLGEESEDKDGSSGLRWVVDPLDGTVNFLFGIPQWCVSVAVQDDRGSLAGAIYDPIREEMFTAIRGGPSNLKAPERESPLAPSGARRPATWPRLYSEQPLQGSRCRELASAMVATGFAYDADVRAAQAQVLARAIPHVRDIRRFGSAALDLAWTAAGRYDAYFERTVKPWDIAAGTLICEAAGLRVVELPVHEDLPWGILVAPPALCGPLLELVGGPA
jgi:myo-inositol-1(or 4)-monophosphatase